MMLRTQPVAEPSTVRVSGSSVFAVSPATSYLVGTMDKWNNAKQAEEHDRVKHDVTEL